MHQRPVVLDLKVFHLVVVEVLVELLRGGEPAGNPIIAGFSSQPSRRRFSGSDDCGAATPAAAPPPSRREWPRPRASLRPVDGPRQQTLGLKPPGTRKRFQYGFGSALRSSETTRLRCHRPLADADNGRSDANGHGFGPRWKYGFGNCTIPLFAVAA